MKSEAVDRQVAQISREKDALRVQRGELLKEENARREERRRSSEQVHALDLNARELRQQMESLAQRIEEEYQVHLADVVADGASAYRLYLAELRGAAGENPNAAPPAEPPNFEDVREELESRVARLRRQLKLMGSVNTESLRDLEELERRFTQLSEQLADLVEAKRTLEEILRRISEESKRLFNETFQLIRGHFKRTVPQVLRRRRRGHRARKRRRPRMRHRHRRPAAGQRTAQHLALKRRRDAR